METLSTRLETILLETAAQCSSPATILRHVPRAVVVATTATLCLLVWMVAYLFQQRRATQRLLEAAGLPTVFWTPRFWNYYPETTTTTTAILPSTSITGMLPRMIQLQGPLGMYGTVYGIRTAVVHVAHPVVAKAVLQDSSTSKRPAYNHFTNFCGRGVFTSEGDDWKTKRVAVLHALLRSQHEVSWEDRVLEQAHVAATELIEAISVHQKNNRAFNVVPLIQQATIGLIFRYITHQDIPKHARSNERKSEPSTKNNGDTKASPMVETTSSSTAPSSLSLLHRYLQSVTDIRMIVLAQSRSVWFLLPRWCYAMFASLYQQEETTLVAIRSFAHLAVAVAHDGSPLMKLKQGTSHRGGKRMTPSDNNTTNDISISQDLLEETITLLFAGQDTSAATLSWTLHLLSLHPEIQQRLAQEVRSVLSHSGSTKSNHNNNSPRVTKAMIGNMPYLDAVIKESMRLYPVAPFVVRRLTRDIVIPVDETIRTTKATSNKQKNGRGSTATPSSVRLPQGSMACLWIYSLHHHPDYWSQPEDFVPERWLATGSKRDPGISNGAYMPFAVGPRNCLGQPLAQWILRSLLARLVHRYNFQDEREGMLQTGAVNGSAKKGDDSNVDRSKWRQDMQAGFTVLPRGGVHLVATERR